jgi:hypothetical protein
VGDLGFIAIDDDVRALRDGVAIEEEAGVVNGGILLHVRASSAASARPGLGAAAAISTRQLFGSKAARATLAALLSLLHALLLAHALALLTTATGLLGGELLSEQ